MIRTISVLGTRLACVDYETAFAEICRLAREDRPSAVTACNTHLVSAARHKPEFGRILGQFDLILPDGMPLIWAMNMAGGRLEDRVYGPYFMRHALLMGKRPWKHFFFGGTQTCLDRLREEARRMQPDLEIAGVLSPPYRAWTEEDEAGFAREIEASGADFIWVALGGERQESWILRNQHRYRRGVFLAVGDAFELLAGNRPFAPAKLQRMGLTWLYRFYQEPRRLGRRYLQYNSLFLWYLLKDFLLKRKTETNPERKWKIAFVGSRGVPARYSGFEKVVQELGSRLAARGHRITVHNRKHHYKGEEQDEFLGMKMVYLPTWPSKSLETIVHTFLSLCLLNFSDEDIIYICGVGNAPLAWIGRLSEKKILINVDGADYQRRKWGGFARWWLKHSEQWGARMNYPLVADNRQIVQRYQRVYGKKPLYISYGVDARTEPVERETLEDWNLKFRGYILYVSRLTPENDAALLLRAHARMKTRVPLVIVGDSGYEKGYFQELQALAAPEVIFTGSIFGNGYVELSQGSAFFVMPAAIEATRLVLLDQMSFGAAILYRDVPATREVLGDAAEAFSGEDLRQALCEKMEKMIADPGHCRELGNKALERAKKEFSWEKVVEQYEGLFAEMMGTDAKPNR